MLKIEKNPLSSRNFTPSLSVVAYTALPRFFSKVIRNQCFKAG